jgi:CHAD domain-containing protein
VPKQKKQSSRAGVALEVSLALEQHVGDASRRLAKRGALNDEQIHEARKDLKRARAVLRLLREVIGDRAYRRENASLRDAARPLSAARDAKVLFEALTGTLEPGTSAARVSLVRKLRVELETSRHTARRALEHSGAIQHSAAALREARTRIEGLRVAGDHSRQLYTGLERLYRRGRKALAQARREPTPENLHEWRKQVKYLGQALTVLGGAANGTRRVIERAERVAQKLGDDHDLVLLEKRISAVHAGSRNAHRALSAQIADKRKKLQSKALKSGRALYDRKPGQFVKRVRTRVQAQRA